MAITVKEYSVWSPATRWFHWINVLCILILTLLGLLMLYKRDLGFVSLESAIALKRLHVIVGYVFVSNLLIRIIGGFFAKGHNHWKALCCFKPGYFSSIKSYLCDIKQHKPQRYLGHNPLGRLAIIAIYGLLILMSITGLVRASTDIYYPPAGTFVASYIAKPGVDPASLQPYDKTQVDPSKWEALSNFKRPFGKIHLYGFYALALLILLHITAVIITDIREGGGLISSMFTGKKSLQHEPTDDFDQKNKQK